MKVKSTLQQCSCSVLLSWLKTGSLILFLYIFSISLTFYNQRFIHIFKFPLSITMVHLVTKFIMSSMVRGIISCKTGEERIVLDWSVYIKRIALIGIASSLDIGLSNWSLELITVSLYTMSKSTVIIFILGFAILFKLEKLRCSLVLVVLFIFGGLFMFTYESTQFNVKGFSMVMVASVLSGVRWTVAQLVTQKDELGLGNPVDMMYHVQPWMILTLLPLSSGFEALRIATNDDAFGYKNIDDLLWTLELLALGALLAFMLEFSEFLLIKHTSSLTLSVAGIFKEICTLFLAAKLNGDKMNAVNIMGMAVCICGIILHVSLKAVENKSNSSPASQHETSDIELLLQNGDANEGQDDADDEIDVISVPHYQDS